MTHPSQPTVSLTKAILDLVFWLSLAGGAVLTVFLAISPLVMRDGRTLDAAFPVAIGEGTPRPVLPLEVVPAAAPDVQRAVLVDARGELRLQTTSWPLQFLPNLGILAALWLAVYVVGLMRGVLRRVKAGEPFARANVRALRIIGGILIAVGILGPVLEYLVVRAVLAQVALTGTMLTAPFDVQGNVILAGLLVLVLAGIFRHGAHLEREQALTV